MFTQQEAEDFVKNIFENIFVSGKAELLRPYYAADFSGHYQDETFYYEDLVKRVNVIHEEGVSCDFKVERAIVLGDFINSTCNMKWVNKSTNESYSAKQIAVWLIKDKKIQESWVIMDKETLSFQEINQDFKGATTPFKMFTVEEAKSFFEGLNENIFINYRLNLLLDYYSPDFVGHASDELFDLEDIKQRALAIKDYTRDFKISLQNVLVSDNIVTVSSKISCFNKFNDSFYEVLQFNTYLIEDRKIKELWVILDSDSNAHKELSKLDQHNYQNIMLPFEINNKSKSEYLNNLNAVLDSAKYRMIRLSAVERECLYYYLNGYSAKETAAIMGFSPRTIETYILLMKEKFNCSNRLDLRKQLFPNPDSGK